MFYIKHRSIKVTLFSEIHIKIFSKISLTYHQIAPFKEDCNIDEPIHIASQGLFSYGIGT